MHINLLQSILESSNNLYHVKTKSEKLSKRHDYYYCSPPSQPLPKMARSIFVPLSALLSLVSTFRCVLSHPILSGVSFESTPSLSQDKQIARGLTLSPSSSLTVHENMTGWTWFYVSGDGSQILSVKGP